MTEEEEEEQFINSSKYVNRLKNRKPTAKHMFGILRV